MSKVRKNSTLIPNDFGKLRRYCSPESISHLERSMKSLEHGRPATISFPLYGKRDSSVIRDFITIMEKLDLPRWLIEYEKSRLAKVGPQGGLPTWKDLYPLFMLYKTAVKDVKFVDDAIIHDMEYDYKMLHCRLFGIDEAMDHLKRTNKIETRAAGWNQFNLKKTDPDAQREAKKLARNGEWVNGFGYVFARYNKLKLRIFMVMPFSSMLVQSRWYIPFLANIQNDVLQKRSRSKFTAWADKVGFEKCFAIMGEEISNSNLRDEEKLIYFSNDFEKMDTRTGSSQYKSLFVPILAAAHHTSSENRDLSEAMLFTTTAPVISPSGTMTGNHGTASGAEVTNGGECVCNDYYQRRFLKILQQNLTSGWRLLTRRFNGDDSALVFAITCSKDVFRKSLMASLKQACDETGFDIQFDKLDVSDTFGKYCQNVYYYDRKLKDIIWYYPAILVLNSIMNPEHQYTHGQWDKDYRDIDVTIKLDNAATHPAFHQLIDYVNNGMKYKLLGKSESETRRILSKYEGYRALQTLGERYNRVDYDIKVSPTVKYILDRRR